MLLEEVYTMCAAILGGRGVLKGRRKLLQYAEQNVCGCPLMLKVCAYSDPTPVRVLEYVYTKTHTHEKKIL